MDNLVSTRFARAKRWKNEATLLIDFGVQYAAKIEKIFPGFGHKFAEAFSKIQSVEFAPQHDGAAFEFDEQSGRLVFNSEHILKLLDVIEADLARSKSKKLLGIPGKAQLVRLALRLFFAHEIRHWWQGVRDYPRILALKNIGAERLIAQLDLIADVDAAKLYAIMRMIETGEESEESYIGYFAEALFFIGTYCFSAFGLSLQKPSKIARALGLTMVLARIAVAKKRDMVHVLQTSKLPLDTPLMPILSPDFEGIGVMALDDLRVVAIDPSRSVLETVESLCEQSFDYALELAIELNKQLEID